MANPQPEPFVKFSKELLDALLLSSMPAGHKEVVLAIIRRTYGDHGRKSAYVSYAMIRQMTGRADSGIRRAVRALENEGVIVKIAEPTFRTPAMWALNKNYENWGRWSVHSSDVLPERIKRQSATRVAEGAKQVECHQSDRVPPEWQRVQNRQSATTVAEESATRVAPLLNIDFIDLEISRARARGDDGAVENVENSGEYRIASELADWAATHIGGWERSENDIGFFERLMSTWSESQVRTVLGSMGEQSSRTRLRRPYTYLETALRRRYPIIRPPTSTVPTDQLPAPTAEDKAEAARILREARLCGRLVRSIA